MTRLITPALIAAALIAPGLAHAQTQPETQDKPRLQAVRAELDRAQTRSSAVQPVMICETDAATRCAYQREFGAAPVFVTAEDAMAARRAGEHWAAPRCMTERQYERLVSSTQDRAGL